MSRWLRIHSFLQCFELQYAHFDKVIDDEGVLLGRVFFFWLLPLNILLSSLPTNNVNPKIMEVVSLCRSTLDANSPSPRSQIPSLTQKGYAIYKSTTTFCALCILSCNLGLVHFWAIWLAKLDNTIFICIL